MAEYSIYDPIELRITDQVVHHRLIGTAYDIVFVGVMYATNKGDFRIEFENLETGEVIIAKEPRFQIRERVGSKGAIRYATVGIEKRGEYAIRFVNIEDLKTDRSMLPPMRWVFPLPLKPEKIKVLIRRC